ncbi:MAG: hypothetical protein J6035_02090 [Bacteroidaceae bacterium]|nr:hypothetical protein [Bacteroidaceae bacterium]
MSAALTLTAAFTTYIFPREVHTFTGLQSLMIYATSLTVEEASTGTAIP